MSGPATPSAESTTSSSTPQAAGLRRRDVIVGAFGAAGGISALLLDRSPRVWAGDVVVPREARVSYSQFGDDLIAYNLFKTVGVKNPSYLDIGGFDPVVDSNTYLFYTFGSRGVIIEPNMGLTDRIRKVRPGDTLLVAGIGTDDTAATDYYMLDNPGLNTFDKEQAERIARETEYKIRKVVKMPLLGINRVIAENFGGVAPDFISIDIEGLDYAVLKTLDFKKYRPKLICAETLITNTLRHNPDTTRLLIENGYEVRGMTVANTFYLDKALLKG